MADIGRKIKPTTLGELPPDLDPRLKEYLEALAYALDLREGRVAAGTNSRFVTIQDLVDAGVVTDGVIK